MPNNSSQFIVANGNTENLKAKLIKNAGERLSFIMEVKPGTYLAAVQLQEDHFASTIGSKDKAAYLPYTVVIENNQARILRGRFYIALSNPTLSMGQFMKIMSTPGNIRSEYERLFQ